MANEFNKVFWYREGRLIWGVGSRFGFEAGTVNSSGYKVCKHKGKMYFVHRIIYEMHTGESPKFIDHIDGNRLNNRIENLREATPSQNQCNHKRSKKNTSGKKNVFFVPKLNKFRVRVQIDGTRKDFGYFDDIESAEAVAIAARNQMHKEFACHE